LSDDLISLDEFRREMAQAQEREERARWESAPGVAGQGQPAPPNLNAIDPIAWAGKPVPPRRWLVSNMIPWGAVTLLGGDGGVGKSLLTLQAQVASATGINWVGREISKVKSVGFYCEDDQDEIHRRLADITSHYDMDMSELENMRVISRAGEDALLAVPPSRYDETIQPTPLYAALVNECKEFGAQLAVIDTAADTFGGLENARSQVRIFVGLLRRLALDIDGVVLLTAHPSVAGLLSGSGLSGSTAWNNSVRARMFLTRPEADQDGEPDTNARTLKLMKNNYGDIRGDISMHWKNGVFMADQADTPTVAAINRGNIERDFLEALDRLAAQGKYATDAQNSPRYAPQVMRTALKIKHSKHDLEAAMNALFNAGSIVIGSFKMSNRHAANAIIRSENK
jgi:RecA-family ATPase